MVSSNAYVELAVTPEMVEVLRPYLARQGKRGGQAKLSAEDQLLVALEYWREYRSQFHIGVGWEIYETTVGRNLFFSHSSTLLTPSFWLTAN